MAGAGACCHTQCTVPSGVARMTLRECNKTGDAVGCSLVALRHWPVRRCPLHGERGRRARRVAGMGPEYPLVL